MIHPDPTETPGARTFVMKYWIAEKLADVNRYCAEGLSFSFPSKSWMRFRGTVMSTPSAEATAGAVPTIVKVHPPCGSPAVGTTLGVGQTARVTVASPSAALGP